MIRAGEPSDMGGARREGKTMKNMRAVIPRARWVGLAELLKWNMGGLGGRGGGIVGV